MHHLNGIQSADIRIQQNEMIIFCASKCVIVLTENTDFKYRQIVIGDKIFNEHRFVYVAAEMSRYIGA